MEQPFEEIAAPLGQGAWNDDALLDAFDRAVSAHGINKKDKSSQTPKEPTGKKKSTIIFKRNPAQEDEESEDGMDAFVAKPEEEVKPQNSRPSSHPPANPQQTPYIHPDQSQKPHFESKGLPVNPTSMMPTVPDMEEQEALSQLLLAWYQAGFAAGRYASIRQRKHSFDCSNKLLQTIIHKTTIHPTSLR